MMCGEMNKVMCKNARGYVVIFLELWESLMGQLSQNQLEGVAVQLRKV